MIKVKVQRTYVEVSKEDLSQIERSFNFAIDRFEHKVRDVEVTIKDLNGPRGGIDKRCSVQLRLYPRGLLVVRSSAASLFEAVNDACDKMQQVLARRLSKQNSRTQMRLINKLSHNASVVN